MWDFSQTQDEAAVLTGVGVFAGAYLLDGEPIKTSLGMAIMAVLAIVGYSGYSKAPTPTPKVGG